MTSELMNVVRNLLAAADIGCLIWEQVAESPRLLMLVWMSDASPSAARAARDVAQPLSARWPWNSCVVLPAAALR